MSKGSYKIIYIQQMLGRWGEIVPILERLLNIIRNSWSMLEEPFLTLRELIAHLYPSGSFSLLVLIQLHRLLAMSLKVIRGL